jgi:hypothetical protein
MQVGLLHSEDLLHKNGNAKSDNGIYNTGPNKTNLLQEIFLMKYIVIKQIKRCDTLLTSKISANATIIHSNKRYIICDQNTNLFMEF